MITLQVVPTAYPGEARYVCVAGDTLLDEMSTGAKVRMVNLFSRVAETPTEMREKAWAN